MATSLHPIAIVMKSSGLDGNVCLKPLSRYFDEYIEGKRLALGFSEKHSSLINLELIMGMGKKRRFKFKEVDSVDKAQKIVGQTLFVEATVDDNINMISKQLLNYMIVTEEGKNVGKLKDVMWLPNNDAYVINNSGKEILIPIIPEVIKVLDHDNKRIMIAPMDGLLD